MMYEMGYELGRHWAMRDATPEQILSVKAFGDGNDWVAIHASPAEEFTRIIDPEKSDFMGTGDSPSGIFVAGFIDGAQSVEPLNQ